MARLRSWALVLVACTLLGACGAAAVIQGERNRCGRLTNPELRARFTCDGAR